MRISYWSSDVSSSDPVADLSCEVEEDVLAPHQVLHSIRVTHVRDVDLDLRLDSVDVEEVPAIVREERIDEEHLRSEGQERAGEVAPDKRWDGRRVGKEVVSTGRARWAP